MKKLFVTMMLLIAATTMNAQTIVKGDMNDDNELTITDAVSVVDVILGKAPMQTISLGGDPYGVDNTLVIGTWYAPDGSSFVFNEDGTTTYPGGATYEFMPITGRLLIYLAKNRPVKVLPIVKATSEYLLVVDYATGGFTYYTKSTSLASGITLDQTTLTMNSGTSAQLTASVSPETAFASITWTSSNENVATVDANGNVTAVAGGTCVITATVSGSMQTAACSVTVKQLVASITLSQTTVVFEELGSSVLLTATVLPDNATNKGVVWSSSNEEVAYVVNGRVATFDYGTAIITCEAADGSGVNAICTICIVDPCTYVDLGLPSGTLWATCNIGAASPEDYGDYFAWGETTGYNNGKTKFSWSTYFDTDDNGGKCNKYNGNGGLTELELEDDAAYVNLGPAWCMPSKEQFDELRDNINTTTEWTTLNNVYGRKFTSNINGKSIFLPAAGRFSISSPYEASKGGYYWTRLLNESNSNGEGAFRLSFHSGYIGTGHTYRYYGFSVRPVRLSE